MKITISSLKANVYCLSFDYFDKYGTPSYAIYYI